MTARYRADIDGVRGLAVVLVVLYHVGVPPVSGGFVGVDVFFVLSGYLITTQLVAGRDLPVLQQLRDFYARRARRILPALSLMTLAMLAAGIILLLPTGEQQELSKSALASSLFVSNLYFWRASNDYFGVPSDQRPLLHTWSLSTEEQFYLIWPLLLAILWFLRRRLQGTAREWAVPAALGVIVVASFAISARWAVATPTSAFYLLPSRLWEIGAGALLSFVPICHPERAERVEGSAPDGFPRGRPAIPPALGAAAILLAATTYDVATPFPGWAALAPVLGTCLLLVAGARDDGNVVSKLLSASPLRRLGEVSYSWYLWHWPLLSFARMLDVGERRLPRDLLLSGVAFAIAYVSTRYIEQPIRRGHVKFFRPPGRAIVAGLILTSIVGVLAAGLGMQARTAFQVAYLPESTRCGARGTFDRTTSCTLSSGSAAHVILSGDSHAAHWSPSLAAWGRSARAEVIESSHPACSSLVEVTDEGDECKEFSRATRALIDSAARADGPVLVVLSLEWRGWLQEGRGTGRAFAKALDGALTAFEQRGVRALLIGPSPVLPYPVPRCLRRYDRDHCRVSRAVHDSSSAFANKVLRRMQRRHPTLQVWDPTAVYCDAAWCRVVASDGTLLFRDTDHLTRSGALAGLPRLAPVLDSMVGRR